MIAWPHLARDAAAATPAPVPVDWPRAGSRLPVAPPPEAEVTEAPLAGRKPHPPADAALEEKPAGALPPPARRRRWPMVAALALSLAAHAALASWLAGRFARPGMEADTDAISVELVLEQAAPAEVASVAGAARASDGGDEGTPGAQPAPETLTPAPPEESLAAVPPDASPVAAPSDEAITSAPPDTPADQVRSDEPAKESPTETVEAASPDKDIDTGDSPEATESEPVALSDSEAERFAERVPAEAATAPVEPVPTPQAKPVMPPEPLPPVLTVLDPFRTELATPPVVPPPPADDIPLELVPVPMPRPARPVPVAASERPAEPPERKRRVVRQTPDRAPAKERGTASRREQAETPKPRQRAETGPARAQTAGNAARSASSAGAVASYARKVNGHLQRHKRYPEDAEQRQLRGTVRLAVSIDRGGRLVGARVSNGSGHPVLDREALAAAKRAAPYPRPPDGVRADPLTLTFTLRFGR